MSALEALRTIVLITPLDFQPGGLGREQPADRLLEQLPACGVVLGSTSALDADVARQVRIFSAHTTHVMA
jgi:hypothetical protein